MEAVVERGEGILASRRESITLFKRPVTTVRLLCKITVKTIIRYMVLVARHPLTIYIAFPLIVLATLLALFVLDDPSAGAFKTMDVNRDGFLTASEISEYYSQVLSRPDVKVGLLEKLFPTSVTGFTKQEFVSWWNAKMKDDAVRNDAYFSHDLWYEVSYLFADFVWWLALGVLSSIGLGTGMHSGLLFLFPYIYLTCSSADKCKSTNFWSYPVNPLVGPSDRTFTCITPPSADAVEVSLLARTAKVVLACIVWGAGTAIGEVPPYALSYAAAKQGKKQAELEEVSSYDILNRMKNWTLNIIQKHGFMAILILAAWPNMAFDLCGMACGQFLMPFWTFFGATFIGKALIKVNMQALFFVALFSGDNIEAVIKSGGAGLSAVLPASFKMDSLVNSFVKAVVQAREKIASHAHGDVNTLAEDGGGASADDGFFVALLQWVVVLAVAWFAKSIVETFAQTEQAEADGKKLSRLRKHFHGHSVPRNISDEEILLVLDNKGSSADGDDHSSHSSSVRSHGSGASYYANVVFSVLVATAGVAFLGGYSAVVSPLLCLAVQAFVVECCGTRAWCGTSSPSIVTRKSTRVAVQLLLAAATLYSFSAGHA